VRHDCLHGVLSDLVDQPAVFRVNLQLIDRFLQIELASLPQERASLDTGDEDEQRINR
jgi:hypothetical protein